MALPVTVIAPPSDTTIQAWAYAAGVIITALGTLAILVQQQITRFKAARDAKELAKGVVQLNIKTDAQSEKIDELHAKEVNGSTKLSPVPGTQAPPIPRGTIIP